MPFFFLFPLVFYWNEGVVATGFSGMEIGDLNGVLVAETGLVWRWFWQEMLEETGCCHCYFRGYYWTDFMGCRVLFRAEKQRKWWLP